VTKDCFIRCSLLIARFSVATSEANLIVMKEAVCCLEMSLNLQQSSRQYMLDDYSAALQVP
jgi:hypothetical protein